MSMGTCAGCFGHKTLYGDHCASCIGDGRHGQSGRHYGAYAASPQKSHHMKAAVRHSMSATAENFALPRRSPPALPLHDPTRPYSWVDYIKAASGRLQMMHNLGHLKTGEYTQAKRNIVRAARKHGMRSQFE